MRRFDLPGGRGDGSRTLPVGPQQPIHRTGDDQSPVLLYHVYSQLRCSGTRRVDCPTTHDIGGVMRCTSGAFSLASHNTQWKEKRGRTKKRGNRGNRASGPGEPTELDHIW
jgi:hypothetical protein